MEPLTHLVLCRDPQDDYLLEMALLGRADYLVTEDATSTTTRTLSSFLSNAEMRLVRLGGFLTVLRGP